MTGRPSTATLGYLEVLAAATLWGSSGIFSVHLFRMGVPPESVALLRPVVGVGFLLVPVLVRRRELLRVEPRGLLFLAGLGGLLTGVFQLAYQMSVAAVGVPPTVALLYLAPALVVAAAGPVLGEWPTVRRAALAALSVVGVWLTVLNARGVDVHITLQGVLWGATAGGTYAGYTLFGRRASPAHGALATSLYSMAGGCALLAVALPVLRGGLVLPRGLLPWSVLTLFSLLTIALASLLFYDGLARIEAGRASITATLEPVVATVLATWLLGQHLTSWGWAGLALVVVGVAGAYAAPGRADAKG